MTRYHFVSGLPAAGVEQLMRVLAQNPRFVARTGSGAEALLGAVAARIEDPDEPESLLGPGQRSALLRGTMEAVYHNRLPESVVFDCNPGWIGRITDLARLFPLSRFIVMVRRPSDLATARYLPSRASAQSTLQDLHAALDGPAADRIIVVDRDRFLSEPTTVLDVIYHFIREAQFDHDISGLEPPDPAPGPGPDEPPEDGPGVLQRLSKRMGEAAAGNEKPLLLRQRCDVLVLR